MKSAWIIWLVVLVATCAAEEPKYQGHTAAEWAERTLPSQQNRERYDAVSALAFLGTKALAEEEAARAAGGAAVEHGATWVERQILPPLLALFNTKQENFAINRKAVEAVCELQIAPQVVIPALLDPCGDNSIYEQFVIACIAVPFSDQIGQYLDTRWKKARTIEEHRQMSFLTVNFAKSWRDRREFRLSRVEYYANMGEKDRESLLRNAERIEDVSIRERFALRRPQVPEAAALERRVVTDLVPVMANALARASSDEEAKWVVWGLATFGTAAEPLQGTLMKLLAEHRSDSVRDYSASILGHISKPTPEVIVALNKAAREDASPAVRSAATEALVELGIKGDQSYARLLDDPDPVTRLGAVRALAFRDSGEWMPQIVARLEDPDAKVRVAAAQVVARNGLSEADQATALPLLITMLQADKAAKEIIVDALARFGTLPYEAKIVALARDPSPNIRERTADLLGLMGKDAVGDLIGMLDDPYGSVRGAAAISLGNLGKDAAPSVGTLKTLLGDGAYAFEAKNVMIPVNYLADQALSRILGPSYQRQVPRPRDER